MSIAWQTIKSNWQIIAAAILIALLVVTAKIARRNYDRAITAESSIESSAMVTSNVLRTVAITNTVLEANQNAKQQIALDSQSAAKDIAVSVAGDDCANRAVPAAAVKRLHDYKDSLRAGASGAATSKPDS